MKNTRRIYLILIAAVVMITAVLALVWTLKDNDVKSVPEPAITTAPVKQTKKIVEVEKIIEVENFL